MDSLRDRVGFAVAGAQQQTVRTNYSSNGVKASQLGASEVVKTEQGVALQFYDKKLSKRIRHSG